MVATLVISIITCLTMIGFIILKPSFTIKRVSIGSYWVVSLIGALILILTSLVPLDNVVSAIFAHSAINPIKILVIFITITIISVFLDEVGFFKLAASFALKKAGNNQIKLFIILYLVISFLTIFTSNDIIILTFTPFICLFSKRAKIDPLPYLILEFVAANTWSMFLIIGNPTNIYLATSLNIEFFDYIKTMFLPTIFAGVTSFLLLFAIFYKKLKVKIENVEVENVVIEEKFLLYFGVAILIICIIGLSIANYINIEMWMVSLPCAVVLILTALVYRLIKKEKPVLVIKSLKRAPWELIPFVLSMFVIVQALNYNGITEKIYEFLNKGNEVWVYGISSTLMCNILNNIPMSVLFSSILEKGVTHSAVFATIIGSNLGAFLTPIGALAGIMWSNILKKYEVNYSFLDFIKYGIIICIPTTLMSLLGLSIIV